MIAAAGHSTRLGCHKALMPVAGQTAIHHSARMLARINVSKLYITLPRELLLNRDLRLDWPNTTILPNFYPRLGYAGSIRTVIKCDGAHHDGILIMPVDSPIFCRQLLYTMINLAQALSPDPTVIVPYFYALPGHPVYISKHFFLALLRCHEHGGLRSVIAAHKKCAHAIFCTDARISLNLNTKIDWLAYREEPALVKSKPALMLNPEALPEIST